MKAAFIVSFDLPRHVTRSMAREFVKEALEFWLHDTRNFSEDPNLDPITALDPKTIKVTHVKELK